MTTFAKIKRVKRKYCDGPDKTLSTIVVRLTDMKRRAWLFIIYLLVANGLAFGLTDYFVSIDRAFNAATLVTAVSAAGYTIVAESGSKKRPYLRLTCQCVAGMGLGSVGMTVIVSNVGDDVATDVRGTCALTGQPPIALENNGAFSIASVGAGESVTFRMIGSVATASFQAQQSYSAIGAN
jgi:hypothetical protein